MTEPANMVVLAPSDNVGVAVRDIAEGEEARAAGGQAIVVKEQIPLGHKLALQPIAAGEGILRFGVTVGIATAAIRPGELVHVHNVRSQYLDNVDDHYE